MFLASCDTMVAMGDTTESGCIIFAKNSDRQANEPLSVRHIPARTHPTCSKVMATYISIDQVKKTHACVLFSPSNIFGAEMGFNAEGLVMGNEALFTKVPSDRPALTGMDLVRLVLERCSTSEEGKTTLIELLQTYGQGGNCGFSSPFSYQNSFLIVDCHEAWLIETIGTEYAAKRITEGVQTISNEISFGDRTTFDECSPKLISQAIENGWCHSIDDFHFRRCYSGFSFHPQRFFNGCVKTKFACSSKRQSRAKELLHPSDKQSNLLSVKSIFRVLRDHHQSFDTPTNGFTDVDLCMHAGFGPIRFNQTTGSLVSVLPQHSDNRGMGTHYATCTSCPCLSIFKPIWLTDSSVCPAFLSNLPDAPLTYSPNHLWWKSEVINRNLMKHYGKLSRDVQSERDALETQMIERASQLAWQGVSLEERASFSRQCFEEVNRRDCSFDFSI